MRPYTPVTLSDHKGSFDLMVKVYKPGVNEDHLRGGIMSQFLNQLKPGDTVQVVGPRGHFVYEGRGQFALVNGRRPRRATQLGLIAAGSGVTPILQLLRHLFADNRDQTNVMMIDVNSSEQDIIARDELERYAKIFKSNFSLCHVLTNVQLPEGSTEMSGDGAVEYIRGPLNKDIMAEHLPQPDPGTLVLCCGPPKLLGDVCAPGLRKIGHSGDRVLFY
ncbi:NADH-cytochrome b5 reductase 3-like [Haemaphysalis longicornis]